MQGGPEISFPGMLRRSPHSLGRLTCLKYAQEPWEENKLPREPGNGGDMLPWSPVGIHVPSETPKGRDRG